MRLSRYNVLAMICVTAFHCSIYAVYKDNTHLSHEMHPFRWANVQVSIFGSKAELPQLGILIKGDETLSANDICQKALKLLRGEKLTNYKGRLTYVNGRVIDSLSWEDLADNPVIMLELHLKKED